jgi:hypothetical protein
MHGKWLSLGLRQEEFIRHCREEDDNDKFEPIDDRSAKRSHRYSLQLSTSLIRVSDRDGAGACRSRHEHGLRSRQTQEEKQAVVIHDER